MGAQAPSGVPPDRPDRDVAGSIKVQAEAGRANFTEALRPIVAGTYNLTFAVSGASSAVPDLTASELRVEPSAPTMLRVMQQPGGGEECSPLGSQPQLLVKDAFNNTVVRPCQCRTAPPVVAAVS